MRGMAFGGTIVTLALAGCIATMPKEPTPTGAEDFATFCASCHGADGKGKGAVAATMARAPADLTRLPEGKDFPAARVMSKIYGYQGDATAQAVMPEFGDLLEGETVLYDSGDGIPTPTPLRLVQLAEYIRSLPR